MSQQAIAAFWEKIDTDTGFREEFFKAVPKELSNGGPIVEFAGRHGFEFTEQDLQEAAASVGSRGKLSDAQLEAVAGGIGDVFNHSATFLLRFRQVVSLDTQVLPLIDTARPPIK